MEQPVAENTPQAGRPWYAGAWRSFNTWRRKHWPFRLVVLLLIFGLPVTDRLFGWPDGLQRLVRIAVNAIYLSGAPQARYHYNVYYNAQNASLLRHLLWRELDGNGDGLLDASERERAKAAGLDVSQLTVPVVQADLGQLAAAARALHLVPSWYSAASVQRQAYYAAKAKGEELDAEWWAPVNARFAEAEAWPDYTKWATWKGGTSLFGQVLLESARLFGVGIWLLIWFLAAFAVAAQVRWPRHVGFLTGATGAGVVFALSMLSARASLYYLMQSLGPKWAYITTVGGVACLGGAVGLWAGGLASRVRRPRLAAGVCAALAGAMLVVLAFPATHQACERYYLVQPAYAFGAGSSDAIAYVPLVIGILLLIAGGAGLYLLGWRRRGRAAAGR